MGANREHVLVVAHHVLFANILEAGHDHLFEGDLAVGEHRSNAITKYRHEEAVSGLAEFNIEPAGILRFGALAQHGPQGAVEVERRGDSHVVGHHVHHHPHTRRMGSVRKPLEADPASHGLGDLGVVHNVIPVR